MGVNYSGERFGNYRLQRLLGRGGFATVYLGEHLYLKRLAAIKILHTVLSDQDQRRFLEEARLLANLSHPQIVRVLEFAVTPRYISIQDRQVVENIPFLIMDFVRGNNLRTACPAGSTLSLDVVVSYIKQAASPLQYAHDRGVIHRDIKPENLLLDEHRQVMLTDFGLAVFAPSPELLSLRDIAGTAPYAAPEQLRGKPVFASDQYALGIIAYEWLCGHRPFVGEDAEIIMQHISAPPPRLRQENPSVPAAVEDVVLKALAKEPRQRFPDVLAFAQKLEDASQKRGFGFTYNRLRTIDIDKQLPPAVSPQPVLLDRVSTPPFPSPPSPSITPVGDGGGVALVQSDIDSEERRAASTISMKRNRQRMLQKVRSFWITGVLEQSLRETSLITPELREAQDAVAQPWTLSLYQSEKRVRSFAAGTRMSEVYDQAQGELLILGDAGTGKTTLMLELARTLLERAEREEAHPIPVVLTLSSWVQKQLPLDRWLVEELNSKYQVPPVLGALWVDGDMLLPLLDGLDEVAANLRSACIEAINDYRQKHGLSPLVVCSRLTEYLLYPPRVLLQTAVIVQPLTIEQVKAYLLKAGGGLEIVYQMIRDDLVLRKLVNTPLMLNILVLAYRGKSVEELLEMRFSEQRFQQLFNAYVEQVLSRQSGIAYTPQQVVNWLGNLARMMERRSQTVFYLEHLQPDIKDSWWRRFYLWLAVLLPGALIGGLIGTIANVLIFHAGSFGSIYIDAVYGVVMGYLFNSAAVIRSAKKGPVFLRRADESWNKAESQGKAYLRTVLFVGLVTMLCLGHDKGWVAGVANALFMGVVSVPLGTYLQRRGRTKSDTGLLRSRSRKKRQKASVPLEHIKNGVVVGVCCGLTSVITIVVSQQVTSADFLFLLVLGLRDSVRNALLGTLLSLLLANQNGIICPAEIVSWSWRKFWRSFKDPSKVINSLLLGIVIQLTFGAKQSLQGNMMGSMAVGFIAALLVVKGYYLVSAVLCGISSSNLDNQYRVRANEGIRRSLRYGLLGGVIGLCVAVLSTIVTSILALVLRGGLSSSSLGASLINVIPIGLMGGVLVELLLGGLAFHQHGVLRFIAWRSGALPWNVPRFLDFAVSSVLLHKVGGGYMFIHRFLLEYFASVDKSEK